VLVTVANHAVLIAVSLMFLLPILFILLTALMTDQQAMTTHLIPRPWMWSNFKSVFKQIDLVRYTWNTFLYASLCTVGVVVSCVTVAYAFSRMRWRGRNIVFLLVLSTLMLPQQITTVPLFVVWARDLPNWISWVTSHIGLGATHMQFVGTLKPLIIPAFFGDAFSIFLLRQFFMTIPDELCDAVRVDGGGHWQILRRVVIPLSKPAIMAIALFQFIYSWNDFYGPLVTGALQLPRHAPRAVEPDDGGDDGVHDPRGAHLLPRPARVHRGRDAFGGQGLTAREPAGRRPQSSKIRSTANASPATSWNLPIRSFTVMPRFCSRSRSRTTRPACIITRRSP
jgi:multiple sugar transport system permease protein